MAWLISIKTGNEMKLPRESFSFWNTHRHTDTHPSHPHIIPDFEHQSNHFHVCPVHTRNGNLYLLNDGWRHRFFPCECWAGWAAAAAAVADDDEWNLFLRFPISRLLTHTLAHSTRRLNWSPSYFSLQTCNNNNNRRAPTSHGRSFVHQEAGTWNVNKRGSRAVQERNKKWEKWEKWIGIENPQRKVIRSA